MEPLKQNSFKTPTGHAYIYWSAKARGARPTLLLLHGNPDAASLWTDLIKDYLLPEGYGVIAPDLLGFGSTDKPVGIENYAMSSISKDLIAILDNEGLKQVIPLGHDFGANLASKFHAFAPERVSGLVTLGTAYIPPSPYPFDFDQIKAIQEQYVGYCSIWYFPLFTSEEGYRVIDENVENMFTALHGGGERMKDVCCYKDAMEKWLRDPSNTDKEVLPYARDAKYRQEWIARMKQNSFRAPLDWYKATAQSLDLEAESDALKAGSHVVKIPYLFVAALKDPLAPEAAVQGPIAQGFLPDVTLEEVDASHWCMLERPAEVGQAVGPSLFGSQNTADQSRPASLPAMPTANLRKQSLSASFEHPHQPPKTTRKSIDSMASSNNGGNNGGANAPNTQNGGADDSDTIHVATGNAGQTQGIGATQAPTTTTTTGPTGPPTAPARPRAQAGLGGTRWYPDEDMFVLTILAEEPNMPWREITPRLNAHFRTRPIRVGGRLELRGQRNREAVRQRFRLMRPALQARLDAQRHVGNELAEASEDGASESENEEEKDDRRLARILLDVVEGVKSRKEDRDDEGPGGNDDLPGGGAPIAV